MLGTSYYFNLIGTLKRLSQFPVFTEVDECCRQLSATSGLILQICRQIYLPLTQAALMQVGETDSERKLALMPALLTYNWISPPLFLLENAPGNYLGEE